MNEKLKVRSNFFTEFFESEFGHSEPTTIKRLSGGDIHEVYFFEMANERYVVKLNRNMPKDVFSKEANGLELLSNCSSLNVPEVLSTGTVAGVEYLLLEFVQPGEQAQVSAQFGRDLAKLHAMSDAEFGLDHSNYIGSLHQPNSRASTWAEFFVTQRLYPRLRELRNGGNLSPSQIQVFSRLEAKLDQRFPSEAPALIHGDLWSGNALVDPNGNTWLIDPAVYYGHREMDLGMMKLFGGFSYDVFAEYNAAYPLEEEWESRVRLAQLYPLLVHAVLFGGHYTQEAVQVAKDYS